MLLTCLLASCSDDDNGTGNDPAAGNVTVLSGETLDCAGHYYTVWVEANNFPQGAAIELSTDGDWLQLASDTLPGDGRFDVLATRNTSEHARQADIVFTSRTQPVVSATVSLSQKGRRADGNTDDDLSLSFGIGHGFSIFDEYMSSASLKDCIFSEARLNAFDSETSYSIIQENKRGKEELESMAAYSLVEMSSKLVEESTVKVGVPGFRKTVKRHTEIHKHQTRECYYGYARLYKVVASRNMDVAALLDVFWHNSQEVRESLMSDSFGKLYREILAGSGSTQQAKIREMIENYGTHVVVRASIGGSIDYAFTLDRKYASQLETSSRSEVNQTFGKSKNSQSSSQKSSYLSDKRSNMSFTVHGGTAQTIEALRNEIAGMDSITGFSEDALANWLSSITPDCLNNGNRDNLDVIDFAFVPIWEFFEGSVRQSITRMVMQMAYDEKNSFSLEEIGLDNYEIPITGSDFNFSNADGNASLVRILSVNDEPVVEVCNEYVPSVRTDRRITVFYPIKKGLTSTAQGLFPGDGQNPPAMLSFADGEVYVNPIEGYGCGDVLDKVYYLHGTMYHDSLNIAVVRPKRMAVKEHRLQFGESNVSYAVVKLGSGYWTRKNICETMDWQGSSGATVEKMGSDGTLYANSYSCNSSFFFDRNKLLYSHQVNNLGERERWFMPRIADCEALTRYIGHNHKPLFKNQQSGLDLEFAGCYGPYYILDPGAPANYGTFHMLSSIFMYQDKYCFLAFKDVKPLTYAEGADMSNQQHIDLIMGAKYLVMDQNYEWQLVEYFDKVKDMKFPVRMFRTNYYNYKTSGI